MYTHTQQTKTNMYRHKECYKNNKINLQTMWVIYKFKLFLSFKIVQSIWVVYSSLKVVIHSPFWRIYLLINLWTIRVVVEVPGWLSQSVDHGILHLKVMSLSPIMGVEITVKNLSKKRNFWYFMNIIFYISLLSTVLPSSITHFNY